MERLLANKLYEFILRNNPDLLIRENETGIKDIIRDKIKNATPLLESLLVQNCPDFIIVEMCMDQMTEDLKPSRYHYIAHLLEEQFPDRYNRLHNTGILPFEITNIINHCTAIFQQFRFSACTEEDPQLRNKIVQVMQQHFDS